MTPWKNSYTLLYLEELELVKRLVSHGFKMLTLFSLSIFSWILFLLKLYTQRSLKNLIFL